MNTNKVDDSFVNNWSPISIERIKETFPIFYEANKDKIEAEIIVAFDEDTMEGWLFIDIETRETKFFDYRN